MKARNDPRIIQKETDLINKVHKGILTWDEAVITMDEYLKSLGY